MSYSGANCLDSDNESLASDSEAESGDELTLSLFKKTAGESDKKEQLTHRHKLCSTKPHTHAQNRSLTQDKDQTQFKVTRRVESQRPPATIQTQQKS